MLPFPMSVGRISRRQTASGLRRVREMPRKCAAEGTCSAGHGLKGEAVEPPWITGRHSLEKEKKDQMYASYTYDRCNRLAPSGTPSILQLLAPISAVRPDVNHYSHRTRASPVLYLYINLRRYHNIILGAFHSTPPPCNDS